jgi:hypothetical protein
MTLEKKKNYLVFFIGIIGGVKFRFIGTFYASEIFIFISLFTISWSSFNHNKYARTLFKLAILWLIGAIVTDAYVNNNIIDSLKGQFNIIFFFLLFPYIYWLLFDKPSRLIYYLLACAIASVPNYYLLGASGEEDFGLMGEDIWLYYSFVPVAVGIIAWLYFKSKIKTKIASLSMFCFGLFMLFHNSRNVLLTMAMAAVVLFNIDNLSCSNFSHKLYKYRTSIVRICVFLFLGILLVDNVYGTLAENGILGEYAYNKYMHQKYETGGLHSSRLETFMGMELIMKSPIIGYGSFARDKGDGFHMQFATEHNTEYVPWPLPTERFLPGHSHLVGYWMNHGILGGVFWLYVLWLMWRFFQSGAILYEKRMIAGILMVFTANVWDIFFSPFGDRVGMAFFLMYIVIIYKYFKEDRYGLFR